MYQLRIEPRLDPPPAPVEFCCRCGDPASYANDTGAYCSDCMEFLADDKYYSMALEDKAEWAGFERIE